MSEQIAEIEVRFVNPPKEGKKKGTIKTADNELFGVWPNQIGLFQPGRRYHIEYKEQPFNGRTYRTITKCRPHGQATAATSTPQNGDSMVATVLGAAIQSKAVEFTEDGIARAIGIIRAAVKRAASPGAKTLDDEIPF